MEWNYANITFDDRFDCLPMPKPDGGVMKNSRLPFLIVLLSIIAGGCYIHGYRVISLEDVPSSHRPWQVFLSAEYGSQHFSQASGLFGE